MKLETTLESIIATIAVSYMIGRIHGYCRGRNNCKVIFMSHALSDTEE